MRPEALRRPARKPPSDCETTIVKPRSKKKALTYSDA